MRTSRLLAAAAAAAIALPALAQDTVAPGNTAAPTAPATPGAAQSPTQGSIVRRPSDGVGESQTGLVEILTEELTEPPPPPVEYPDHARRDPRVVGRLNPAEIGLGASPWKGASGAFLGSLMRRMETPVASRWAHIALRNALLARVAAPRNINPVDWAAERAWLLIRMGEADAGRMLVSGVDTDRYTPRMFRSACRARSRTPIRLGCARFRAESRRSNRTSSSWSTQCARRWPESRKPPPRKWIRRAAAAG